MGHALPSTHHTDSAPVPVWEVEAPVLVNLLLRRFHHFVVATRNPSFSSSFSHPLRILIRMVLSPFIIFLPVISPLAYLSIAFSLCISSVLLSLLTLLFFVHCLIHRLCHPVFCGFNNHGLLRAYRSPVFARSGHSCDIVCPRGACSGLWRTGFPYRQPCLPKGL